MPAVSFVGDLLQFGGAVGDSDVEGACSLDDSLSIGCEQKSVLKHGGL